MQALTLIQIADALGISKQAVAQRATREAWPFEAQAARGGQRRFYPAATLPKDVREALLQAQLAGAVERLAAPADAAGTDVTPAPATAVTPAAAPVAPEDLTTRQRAADNARNAVLGEVARLRQHAGVSLESALTTLLVNARAGLLAAHLVGTLKLARDPRGRKSGPDDGLPSVRSLKRWLGKQAQGKSLAPAVAQADMRVKPWHALAISLMQRPQGSVKRWVHAQIVKEWTPALGPTPPSYDVLCHFFREKFSKVDVLVGRYTGMELKNHRRYTVRSRNGLLPAMECHADGWCTHFTAPHPVSGEFVTYELWTCIDYATGYPADPAIGLSESYEVIAKSLENYIRVFGVPLIFQTDSTGSVKNERFEFDPIASLQERLGITVVHPKMLEVGKGNSQANGLAENLHAFYDRESRELATYQGKGMDALSYKRVQRLTKAMVRAETPEARALARQEAERAGKGIVFDSHAEACAWILGMVERRRDLPNRNLPKIADPATGKQRPMTPREALAAHVADGWQPVALSEADLIDAFRPHVRKKVTRGGVSPYSGQRYQHEALEHLNGQEVMVAIDIMNGASVWVKDLDGRLICEAKFESGRQPRPTSLYESAYDKRERAQVRRAEHRIESIEARNPNRVLDVPAAAEQDIAMLLYGEPEPLPARAPAEVVELIPAAPAKPARPAHKYEDITDLALYLHGDELDAQEEAARKGVKRDGFEDFEVAAG